MMDDLVLEEVEVFKYLGSLVTAVGKVKADVQQRVLEGSKVLGGVKKTLYQQVIVPTVTYGAEIVV